MNSNVFLGIVAFVCWSIFSTWYYVTKIKNFDQEPTTTNISASTESKPVATDEISTEKVDTTTSSEVKQPSAPTVIDRVVRFERDSKVLISPTDFSNFLDSLELAVSNRSVNIALLGHTCNLGSEQYNLILGEKRANAIRAEIVNRFPNAILQIESKGESAPIKPNTSEENRQANRRVTIHITTNK